MATRERGLVRSRSGRIDVALDLPRARQLSVGMRAYAEELARRLPRVAPDMTFETVARTTALDRREQLDVAWRLHRSGPRLVHHLSVYAPLFGPRPYVITIHDLIHLRFPHYFKRSVGPYYRTVVRWVAAGAARVITDDERTVADLERFLGVPPRKVRVIPLGVDDAYLADEVRGDSDLPSGSPSSTGIPRAGVKSGAMIAAQACDMAAQRKGMGGAQSESAASQPYFLYVGNRREHKNLATLFAAWSALDPALSVDLLLSGDDDNEFGGAQRPARACGTLRFLGQRSAAELARAYRGAAALVYPSLCEGFGLPMLEAAAVGTPVIAGANAVPGVLRPHVAAFPSQDVDALVALLRGALADLACRAAGERAALSDRARRLAQTLTWDRCAQRTAEVYREVLAESRR